MLEQRICSAAILGSSRQRTAEGQKVNLTCDINDSLRVNDIPVSQTDILGFNGVIQVIDQLLIPDAGKTISVVAINPSSMQCCVYGSEFAVLFGIYLGSKPYSVQSKNSSHGMRKQLHG